MTDILYGAAPSLYTGKLRAYLDWKQIDYVERPASKEVYRDIIVPGIGRPVIPVMQLADGRLLQDTSLIIDHYELTAPGPKVYPGTPLQRMIALLLELYGDEWLVIPAMHYRWNYNEEWVYGEFGKFSVPDASPDEQLRIGRENGQRFKGYLPVLGITPQTVRAIEASYEALLADLDRHFAIYPYLLGTRPSIGDYGLIGPMYAHLYRDPLSGEMMKRLAPNVAAWVERCVFVKDPLGGEFLPDDEVPQSLVPVLARMKAEMMPWLQATAYLYADWAKSHPAEPVPRGVGMAAFTIEGVTGERVASPFALWMLQRPMDCFQWLNGEGRERVNRWLAQTGDETFCKFDLPVRVAFVDHKMQIAP